MLDCSLVKQLMEKEGRSRKWLARQIGIEVASLHHILNGRREPSVPVVKLMAFALNVSEQSLLKKPAEATRAGRKVAAG